MQSRGSPLWGLRLLWVALLAGGLSMAASAMDATLSPEQAVLAAVEINQVQAARGAMVIPISATACWIDSQALASRALLDGRTHATLAGRAMARVDGPRESCRFEPKSGVVRIVLPPSSLKPQRIFLGHDPATVAQTKTGSSVRRGTAVVEELPSLALDWLGTTRVQAYGLTASYGRHQFTASTLSGESSQALRWNHETELASGALMSLGHVQNSNNLWSSPRPGLGLLFQSHHPRRQAATRSYNQIELERPARLRVLDLQGAQLYSSGLVMPGNVLLEALGASNRPGLVQLEIRGLDGERQRLLLPWVASPDLLSPGMLKFEAFGNATEQSLLMSYGLTEREGLRMGLSLRDRVEPFTSITTSRIHRTLLSAGLGLDCAEQCQNQGLLRATLAPLAQTSIQAEWRHRSNPFNVQPSTPTTASSATSSGTPSTASSEGLRPFNPVARWSGSLSVHHRLNNTHSLSLNLSQSDQSLASVAWSTRPWPGTEIQLQHRQQSVNRRNHQTWQLLLRIDLDQKLSASAQAETNGGSYQLATRLQSRGKQRNSESWSLSKRGGSLPSSEFSLRSQRPFGEAQLFLREQGNGADLDVAVSSRVWITPLGIEFGNLGDNNMVVHEIGQSGLVVEQSGQVETITNQRGQAVFTQVPSFTQARFQPRANRLPMHLQWSGAGTEVLTASKRAYRVQSGQGLRVIQETQLIWPIATKPLWIQEVRDAKGRPIDSTADGFIDFLPEKHALPLAVRTRDGVLMVCGRPSALQGPAERGVQVVEGPGKKPSAGSTPSVPSPRKISCEETGPSPPPSSGSEAIAQFGGISK